MSSPDRPLTVRHALQRRSWEAQTLGCDKMPTLDQYRDLVQCLAVLRQAVQDDEAILARLVHGGTTAAGVRADAQVLLERRDTEHVITINNGGRCTACGEELVFEMPISFEAMSRQAARFVLGHTACAREEESCQPREQA
jgi:hypothetical protein